MSKIAFMIVLAQMLSGCLLETETCGFDFIERGEQCVPRAPAPPYRSEETENEQWAPPDGLEEPDQGIGSMDSPYAEYRYLRLVDRTPLEQAMLSDDAPGVDIDAVMVLPPDSEVPIAVIGAIVEVVLPASERMIGEDAPIAMQAGPDGLFFSLGGEGGAVLAELNLSRSLLVGDLIRVIEIPDARGFADTVEVALCSDPAGQDCLVVGETPPSQEGEFVLEGSVSATP